MSHIYVVIGSTGEYSDRSEWMVAAYADEAMAQDHARLASDEARLIYIAAEASDDPYEVRSSAINPHDAGRTHMDYTGTTYYVAPAPLLTAIPDARIGGAA